MAQNCNYIILFKFNRGLHQLNKLSKDLFCSKHQNYFLDAYNKATARPYSYLVIDINPYTPKNMSFYTSILEEEGHQLLFKAK